MAGKNDALVKCQCSLSHIASQASTIDIVRRYRDKSCSVALESKNDSGPIEQSH